MKPLTIAIDGHSSTGKSTLAKQLAKALGYVYVDSGAMYRAVALNALRNRWVSKESGAQASKINARLEGLVIDFELDQNHYRLARGFFAKFRITKTDGFA